jgi:hypothetical protein
MSKMRPELGRGDPGDPCPTNGTAYLMILNAIESRPGLIAGRLQANGEFCSIGAYFHVNKRAALPTNIIDEVAMMNDSMVTVTPRQRKLRMKRWLRWKLACLGMPGYRKAAPPKPETMPEKKAS